MPLIVLGGGAEDAAAPPPPASIIPLREGLLARPPVGNESIAHWYQFSHGRVVTKKVQKVVLPALWLVLLPPRNLLACCGDGKGRGVKVHLRR